MKRLVVDVTQTTGLVEALTLLESGGELLAMSLVLVYAVVIARQTFLRPDPVPDPGLGAHGDPPVPVQAGRLTTRGRAHHEGTGPGY